MLTRSISNGFLWPRRHLTNFIQFLIFICTPNTKWTQSNLFNDFFSPPYTHALDVTCHDRMMLMIQLIKDIIEFGIQIANDIEFNVREKTDTK